MPTSFPEVSIYFGSQTGTAEKLAQQLAEEADDLGVEKANVIDFNNFTEDTFTKHNLVIVCVATHYEGDPCDNTRNFYKWLKNACKDKAAKPLKGMKFAIFGLGDTSYEQFNEMGVQFDKKFEELGAERVYDMGSGNAETFSTETDFEKWKKDLWSALIKAYAPLDTPEQAKKALLRRQSTLEARKLSKQNQDSLPWIINDDFFGDQAEEAEPPKYDMNMRNYQRSVPCKIKSIR